MEQTPVEISNLIRSCHCPVKVRVMPSRVCYRRIQQALSHRRTGTPSGQSKRPSQGGKSASAALLPTMQRAPRQSTVLFSVCLIRRRGCNLSPRLRRRKNRRQHLSSASRRSLTSVFFLTGQVPGGVRRSSVWRCRRDRDRKDEDSKGGVGSRGKGGGRSGAKWWRAVVMAMGLLILFFRARKIRC